MPKPSEPKTRALSNLSLEQLAARETELAAELEAVRVEKKSRALAEIEAIAARAGYSTAELIGKGGTKRARRTGEPGQAKYADPSDPTRTWTGKGRRPAWVNEAVAAGKKLEELAIPKG